MVKAIIVDDEEIVRCGLRDHFHWANHNISIVGDFPDGMTAFSFLCENEVDLIITDIVMPEMNGLTLATQARQKYPDIKLIFVSGYTDAQFLLEALKLNATDFIFKSIDFDELDAAIDRVSSNVRQQKERQIHLHELESLLQENRPLLIQQQYASLLVKNEETGDTIERSCAALGITLNNRTPYILVVIRLSNRWQLLEKNFNIPDIFIDFQALQLLQDFLVRYQSRAIFKSNSGEFVCLLDAKDMEYENIIVTLSIEMQTVLRRDLDAELLLGVSGCFTGLKEIPGAYANTCDAIVKRYFIDSILPSVSIAKYRRASIQELEDKARTEVLNSILEGNRELIVKVVADIMSNITIIPLPEDRRNFLIFLLLLPNQLLQNIPSQERGQFTSIEKLLNRYLKCKDFFEQKDFLLSAILDAATHLHNNNTSSNNAIIQTVLNHMDEHYMEQLSVTILADFVHLSPAYLCVLFKQFTGQTINQYLTMTRLNKAKKMLKEVNPSIEEVCYKVGYLSTSYFSRLFRQNTGMTPSDFRNSVQYPDSGSESDA